METINSFKDLIVWQKSMQLAKHIYVITGQFPKEEVYGLVSQIRRSAVSIPSNIAEGHKRNSKKDYATFLTYALGSAAELETQLLLSQDLYTHLSFTEALSLTIEIQKIVTTIIKKLRTQDSGSGLSPVT